MFALFAAAATYGASFADVAFTSNHSTPGAVVTKIKMPPGLADVSVQVDNADLAESVNFRVLATNDPSLPEAKWEIVQVSTTVATGAAKLVLLASQNYDTFKVQAQRAAAADVTLVSVSVRVVKRGN